MIVVKKTQMQMIERMNDQESQVKTKKSIQKYNWKLINKSTIRERNSSHKVNRQYQPFRSGGA